MIKYIYHISDIHIFQSNYKNLSSSFPILIEKIKAQGIEESLLVIAGDIFESKSYLNTDDIFHWRSICYLLKAANIKTLMIPGNHDINPNSNMVRDNVTLLTSGYKNIKVVNSTCILDGEIFGDSSLEFYIFSPIDGLIPKILDNNNTKIAILHEPVNNALYDNGEKISGARFTAADLTDYDYVLLGDIHKMQFLSPRIAYSGSFVQKTKGENLEKGFIKWNLQNGKGEFHPILLKEVYIKVEAINDTCELPIIQKEQTIRHVSLFYKDCSPEYIIALKETMVKNFGYIHRVMNNTKQTAIEVAKPEINHSTIIKTILGETHPLLDSILVHHQNVIRNRNENNFSTYKLNYLYFENIFCYGDQNYINFNNFHNDLVMLNGKNKEGKSSIIDIIIRVLFNEAVRGLKEDIVNKSKARGFIKISFNIGADEYVVEQLYHRVSKNQQHRLYLNGKNITKDTIIKTYDFLRSIIGNYHDFVNMTTALQNRKFLVDMTQNDFVSLLTKITNVDVLKDVEVETKKEIAALKAVNKKYDADIAKIPEVKETDIIALETAKAEHTRVVESLYNNMSEITAKLLVLNKEFDNTPIPDNLDEEIEAHVSRLNAIKNDPVAYNSIRDLLKENENQLINHDEKIYYIKKRIEAFPEEMLRIITATDYEARLANLDRSEITARIKELKDTTYKPSKELRPLALLQGICSAYQPQELKPLEKCMINAVIPLNHIENFDQIIADGLPNYDSIIKEISGLDKSIKQYEKYYSSLVFADGCVSCVANKQHVEHFSSDSLRLRLSELNGILASRAETERMYAASLRYKKDKEQNEIFARNLEIKAHNALIVDKKSVYEIALAEIKEVENFERWSEMQRLEKQLQYFKEAEVQKLLIENEKLVVYKTFVELKDAYMKLKHLQDIKISNGSKLQSIKKLQELSALAKTNINAHNTKFAQLSETYRINKNNFDNKKNLIATHSENVLRIEFLETYHNCINSKTGIPSFVLKNTCKRVQDSCNAILQKITDFSINIVYDKEIKIYTVENDIQIPSSMGSGAQKFLMDLILRITLTEISSMSSTKMLFVDEGWNSLDKENFIAVANILQKLKGNFDALIIISHISELQSYVDISVNIVRSGYLSKVAYGELTDEEKTVRLLNETTTNNKRNLEFKESVKAAKIIKKSVSSEEVDNNIKQYVNTHGGLENILLEKREGKIFCRGCSKEFNIRQGFVEKHLSGVTVLAKHNKYITSLLAGSSS